jgi:hypothetical protein
MLHVFRQASIRYNSSTLHQTFLDPTNLVTHLNNDYVNPSNIGSIYYITHERPDLRTTL